MSKDDYVEELFLTLSQFKKLVMQKTWSTEQDKNASMLQYSALSFIKEGKKIPVGDLANYLHLSKSSATQLIERLTKQNLVKRENDRNDRRIVFVSLTVQGEKELLSLKKVMIEKMNRLFKTVPEEDLKELVRIHKNIITSLENEN